MPPSATTSLFVHVEAELRSRRARSVDQVRRLTEEQNVGGHDLADDGDRANFALTRDYNRGLIDTAHEQLRSIDRALSRLEQGTYNICEDCGDIISEARLEARPFTSQCMSCLTRRR